MHDAAKQHLIKSCRGSHLKFCVSFVHVYMYVAMYAAAIVCILD